jgi:hypothetical protein
VQYDTAGAGDLEFERLWLALMGISIKKRIIFGSSGVIDTAGAKIGNFIVENLREFEAIC